MNPIKEDIIIDSCVLQKAGGNDKQKSQAIKKVLEALSYRYNLTISSFTVYEMFHGLWGKKAIVIKELLKQYKWHQVSDNTLLVASGVGGLYHEENVDYMSPGDKIIAATAILEKGFVLTENHRDFPHPFFLTEQSIPVIYMTNAKFQKTIDLALYKPDIVLINRRIKELEFFHA